MFTLWYSVLSWKEYREVILDKLSQKLTPYTGSKSKSDTPVCPLPQKNQEPSRIPVVEPSKPPQTIPKPIPTPPPPPPPKAPLPPKLEAPTKPPRSPSPHPLRAEAFEDIEYEEEDSEEEDDDSVVDSLPPPKGPSPNSVNDFINVEIRNQQRDLGPQRYNEQPLKK